MELSVVFDRAADLIGEQHTLGSWYEPPGTCFCGCGNQAAAQPLCAEGAIERVLDIAHHDRCNDPAASAAVGRVLDVASEYLRRTVGFTGPVFEWNDQYAGSVKRVVEVFRAIAEEQRVIESVPSPAEAMDALAEAARECAVVLSAADFVPMLPDFIEQIEAIESGDLNEALAQVEQELMAPA